MNTIYIIIAISVVISIGLVFSLMPKPNYERKKRKYMKKHLLIPIEFWEDYNKVNRRIQNMKASDISKCEGMIDDLIYKYAEFMDAKSFWEKIETITMYFEMRKDILLNK